MKTATEARNIINNAISTNLANFFNTIQASEARTDPEPPQASRERKPATPHEPIPRPRRRRPRLSLRSAEARPENAESALERHERKCKICRHPDREDIETDFLHWHEITHILNEFKLGTRRALYRHARATGLYELRMANIRDAAALIAAQAELCRASGTAVLKAIRACSLIDANGVWHEPPTRTLRHTVIGEPQQASAREAVPEPQVQPASAEISNRHTMRLENGATPTKQSPEVLSNRPKTPIFANSWTRLFRPQKSAPTQEAPRP